MAVKHAIEAVPYEAGGTFLSKALHNVLTDMKYRKDPKVHKVGSFDFQMISYPLVAIFFSALRPTSSVQPILCIRLLTKIFK